MATQLTCQRCKKPFLAHGPKSVAARKFCSRGCAAKARAAASALRAVSRFWSYVNQEGPVPLHRPELGSCWLWLSTLDEAGYGRFFLGKRNFLASRFSYALAYGEIQGGLWALHHCDTPACVRHAHLYLGTHRDNMDDMANRNRLAHGERTNTSKLTTVQVQEIRAYMNGRAEHRYGEVTRLARRYGISTSQVWRVATGRNWRRVAP